MQRTFRINKVLLSLTIVCLISFFTVNVSALDDNQIYRNDNGVELSKNEYNIIIEAYGQEYFENMTEEYLEWFEDLFAEDNEITVNTYYSTENGTRSTSHSTSSKKISIINSCSSTRCTIVTTAQWLKLPVVKSYDVIGARFNNTTLYSNSIITRVQTNNGIEYFDNLKQFSTGFGVSVKLPTDATSYLIDQKFYVNPEGTVFASYQHAIRNISLATSKLYTLGAGGNGSVFIFYGDATDAFDQMNGVSVTL